MRLSSAARSGVEAGSEYFNGSIQIKKLWFNCGPNCRRISSRCETARRIIPQRRQFFGRKHTWRREIVFDDRYQQNHKKLLFVTFVKLIRKLLKMNESYLIFSICEELYGLRVSKIIEVIEPGEITPVPEVPFYIRGITNFRGNILPVVDMRRKFNLSELQNIGESVIVALEAEVKNKIVTVGALVDAVKTVADVDFLEINQLPEIGTKFNPEYIEGIISRDEKYIVLLKIDKILATDELTILNEEGFFNMKKL